MTLNPAIHHRRSMRLKGYDYTQPGAYFVTLVTFHRDEILGEIANGVMKFSLLGQIVFDEWMRSAEIRKEIRLYEDEFVVMPNHLHGIVWIVSLVGADGIRPDPGIRQSETGDGTIVGEDGVRPDPGIRLETGARRAPQPVAPQSVRADVIRPPNGVRPSDGVHPDSGIHPPETGGRRPPQPLQRAPRSLGSFIAGFKSFVTGRAGRELDMTGIWQRNYYDHIIRSENEFQAIWDYIDDNPRKWESDQLHPSAPPNPFNQE